MSNFYLNIEGIDCAGKGGVTRFIVDYLRRQQRPEPIVIGEPGGTPLADAIRGNVKHLWEEDVEPISELLLMFAARRQVLTNIVIPNLSKSDVISDRSWMSTFAYQVRGHGVITEDEFNSVFAMVMRGVPEFDLTIILDVDPYIGASRAKTRGSLDRIELNPIGFFKRAREAYLELAKNNQKIVVIDANQPQIDVNKDVLSALSTLIPTMPRYAQIEG